MLIDAINTKEEQSLEEFESSLFLYFRYKYSIPYMRTIIYVVTNTIKQNPRITKNKLNFLLSKYSIPEIDISAVIPLLISRSMFYCVTIWKHKNNIEHLNFKTNTKWETYEEYILNTTPELKNVEIPVLKQQ